MITAILVISGLIAIGLLTLVGVLIENELSGPQPETNSGSKSVQSRVKNLNKYVSDSWSTAYRANYPSKSSILVLDEAVGNYCGKVLYLANLSLDLANEEHEFLDGFWKLMGELALISPDNCRELIQLIRDRSSLVQEKINVVEISPSDEVEELREVIKAETEMWRTANKELHKRVI